MGEFVHEIEFVEQDGELYLLPSEKELQQMEGQIQREQAVIDEYREALAVETTDEGKQDLQFLIAQSEERRRAARQRIAAVRVQRKRWAKEAHPRPYVLNDITVDVELEANDAARVFIPGGGVTVDGVRLMVETVKRCYVHEAAKNPYAFSRLKPVEASELYRVLQARAYPSTEMLNFFR